MSAYLSNSIDSENYQKNRVTYPRSLYEAVLKFHDAERELAVDVGCGTGIGTFPLLDYFKHVVGCDPSAKMLQTAKKITEKLPDESQNRIDFMKTSAETLDDYFGKESVDLIIAGESIQYTNLDQFFRQAYGILKPRGTLSYWFYCDPIFIDYPKANEIFKYYVYEDEDSFGPLWSPQMNIVRDLGSTISIPEDQFEDIKGETYIPLQTVKPGSFRIYKENFTFKDLRDNMSTWGVYQTWLDRNKDGKEDIIDVVIDKIKSKCNLSDETKLRVEWETAFFMARKKTRIERRDCFTI